MTEKVKLAGPVRNQSPCKDCTEKFTACHDRCPKDKRGEYGYKEFLGRIKQAKDARRNYSMKYDKVFFQYDKRHRKYCSPECSYEARVNSIVKWGQAHVDLKKEYQRRYKEKQEMKSHAEEKRSTDIS